MGQTDRAEKKNCKQLLLGLLHCRENRKFESNHNNLHCRNGKVFLLSDDSIFFHAALPKEFFTGQAWLQMIYMKTVLWKGLGVLPIKLFHEELTLKHFCEEKLNWNKQQQVQAQEDEHMCKTQKTAGYIWLGQSLTFAFD